MPTARIIPGLDVADGRVVKGVKFRDHREVGEQLVLAGFLGPRAIEIDAVRPCRPVLGEAGQRFGGALGIARLAIEIALRQADAAAGDEVDGGVEDHALR